MEYKMSVISTSSAGIEPVSNLLVICGVGGFEVCDSEDFKEFLQSRTPAYDYIDDELMCLCAQRSLVKFYTAVNSQGDDIIAQVELALLKLSETDKDNSFGTLELSVTVVDDSDWKDNWKQFYRPMEIGSRLIVAPAWEQMTTDKLLLKIDPGMAFGTGFHETTSLCLELLQKERLEGKRVLDVGCGSGILSQAAVLMGADSACGCDIDEAAVCAAKSNAVLNGLEDKTSYYKGDLLEFADGKYEIVVANIVADIIMQLTRDIKKVLPYGGVFISSGIIDSRVQEVVSFIRDSGFEITQIKERRGWAAIRAVLK